MQPRRFYEVRDADKLRAAIATSGYTYARLARYADLRSRQFVHGLATGAKPRCSPKTAKLIAEAVQRPVDELFVPNVSYVRGQKATEQRTDAAA